MEKKTFMNLSVRNTQLVGYALFNLSSFVAIILVLLELSGLLTNKDILQWVNVFNGIFFALCSFVAYLMLSQVAANLPTRNVMKQVGIFVFVVSLFSVAFDFYQMNNEINTMLFTISNAIFFILKTAPLLYLFGVIVRNNPACRKAKVAINVLYFIAFIVMFLASQVVPLFMSHVGLEMLNILQCLAYLVCTYVLFTSDVFGGQTDYEPASKGAYRFWNKYFTMYIVTIFGSALLLALIIP